MDILRPRTPSGLISARAFERGFVDGMGRYLRIEVVDARAWPRTLLGERARPEQAASAFAERCRGYDFLCPGPGPLAWSPELLRLRNLAAAPIRALLIAHAPGVFVPEWALLAPLLGPGDRIVAPSETAAAVIRRLCPSLGPHVRVAAHPIPGSATVEALDLASSERRRPRLIGLGRLVRPKLVHRLIEAMDLLARRGLRARLDLAGPVNELGAEGPSAYVRSLRVKLARLGLDDAVRLVGTIEDPAHKLAFVRGASALINLSVSLEESFGKAIAEAQRCGVPSLCTRWGGLAETAGPAGLALDVAAHDFGVDLEPEAIADAIEALVDDPPAPSLCVESSRRFEPCRVAARYREILDEALDEFADAGRYAVPEPGPDRAATPPAGLLAETAPLTAMSWAEAMDLHVHEQRGSVDLRGLSRPELLGPGAQLRGLVCLAVRAEVQRTLAGLPARERPAAPPAAPPARPELDAAPSFLDRCARALDRPGSRASRVVILDLFQRLGHDAAVERGLAQLHAQGLSSKGLSYVEVEARLREGAPGEALALCEALFDPEALSEHEAHRLVQFARACHQLGQSDRALSALRRWTERFPDSPDSAGPWRQRSALALLARGREDEARDGLARCVALVGPRPELVAALDALSPEVR